MQCKKELACYTDLISAVEVLYLMLKGNLSLCEIDFFDLDNETITLSNDEDLGLAIQNMAGMKAHKFNIKSNTISKLYSFLSLNHILLMLQLKRPFRSVFLM